MSNKAVTWAYDRIVGDAGAKFTLVTLADYADEDGFCYPGQKTLAASTEQGVRTIRRQLDKLETLGFIRRRPRYTPNGRTSDGYQLSLAANLAHSQTLPAIHDNPSGQALADDPSVDPSEDLYIQAFDQFWTAYPRHVSKKAARKAWRALKPGDDLVMRILQDIANRKRGEWAGKEIAFVPHPATYLNGERWEDEAAMPAVPVVQPYRQFAPEPPPNITPEQARANIAQIKGMIAKIGRAQ